MTKGASANVQNETSNMSVRVTLPNEASQNPKIEVVQDDSHVISICQKNGSSSMSHIQEYEGATRMSSSNNRNLEHEGGLTSQSRTFSYFTPVDGSCSINDRGRSANQTTDEGISKRGAGSVYRRDGAEEGADETIYQQGRSMYSQDNRKNNSTGDQAYSVIHQQDYESANRHVT